jgi:hypothetical protein
LKLSGQIVVEVTLILLHGHYSCKRISRVHVIHK